MRPILVAPPILALALAACGDGGNGASNEKMSAEEVRAAAEDAVVPQPGLYRATMQFLDVEIAGVSAGQVDTVRNMMGGGTQTTEYCLTQEQVDRGYEEMLRQSQGGECIFERFEANGGEIDAAMTCPGPQGEPMRITMEGTGTETSSVIDMTMEQDVAGMGTANISIRAEHERIGACG